MGFGGSGDLIIWGNIETTMFSRETFVRLYINDTLIEKKVDVSSIIRKENPKLYPIACMLNHKR